MCVLISLQILYETFLILRTNERDIIKVHRWWCMAQQPTTGPWPAILQV